jgi:hypothetical protein
MAGQEVVQVDEVEPGAELVQGREIVESLGQHGFGPTRIDLGHHRHVQPGQHVDPHRARRRRHVEGQIGAGERRHGLRPGPGLAADREQRVFQRDRTDRDAPDRIDAGDRQVVAGREHRPDPSSDGVAGRQQELPELDRVTQFEQHSIPKR